MKKNNSRKYLQGLNITERKELSKKLGVTQEYLYHIGHRHRTPHRVFAIRLEITTKGKVKESDFDAEVRRNLK